MATATLEPRQLFLKGLAKAESSHKEAFQAACWIAELLGAKQDTVTITDVSRYVSPEALGNSAGGVFRGPSWEFMGYERSSRSERQAGTIGRWRLRHA